MAPGAQTQTTQLKGPVNGAFYGHGGNPHCRPRIWLNSKDAFLETKLSICAGRVEENGFCLRTIEIFEQAPTAQKEQILRGALEALAREVEENGRVPKELLKRVWKLFGAAPWTAHRVLWQDFLLDEFSKKPEERSRFFQLFKRLSDHANKQAGLSID